MRTGKTTRALEHALTIASKGTLVTPPTSIHYTISTVLSWLSFGLFDIASYLEKKAGWKTWNVFYVVPTHSQTFNITKTLQHIEQDFPATFQWKQRSTIIDFQHLARGGTLRVVTLHNLSRTLCGHRNVYAIFDHYTLETGIPEHLQPVYKHSLDLPTKTTL